MNDGRQVHLYYSKMFHEYVAYGYSAYIVLWVCMTEETSLSESYAVDLQMPYVRVNRAQISLIQTKGLLLIKSVPNDYYNLESYYPFDERKYDEWAFEMRSIVDGSAI